MSRASAQHKPTATTVLPPPRARAADIRKLMGPPGDAVEHRLHTDAYGGEDGHPGEYQAGSCTATGRSSRLAASAAARRASSNAPYAMTDLVEPSRCWLSTVRPATTSSTVAAGPVSDTPWARSSSRSSCNSSRPSRKIRIRSNRDCALPPGGWMDGFDNRRGPGDRSLMLGSSA